MNPTALLLQPEVHELILEGRYTELRAILHEIPHADVADILGELDPAEAAIAFRFLQRDDAASVFSYIAPEKQEELVKRMGEDALRIVEAMSPDDRVKVLDELPAEVAQKIIASLSTEERRVTQAILGYPQGTVGRLMTPDYIRVRPEWTCARALEHIRRTGRDAETINVLYVVDETGKLIDDIRLRQVLLAEPEALVETLMNRSFHCLRADQPQSEAVQLMSKYDRTALPVVDTRGALVGIVTVDDVIDVAQQQATESMQKLGGVGVLEEPFDRIGVGALVKKRAPWLALLFMSEILTSNALVFYDDQIKRLAVLAVFIPGIISSGGNSGSQSSTLVIRALALGEVGMKDWWAVLRRELKVAGVLAAMIATIGFGRICLWGQMGLWVEDKLDPVTGKVVIDPATGKAMLDYTVQSHYTMLALAIACSLVGVVAWGCVMGSMLPFLLKRCGLDPASSSTPFVATLVDVTGIIIYFTVAMTILSGTLL